MPNKWVEGTSSTGPIKLQVKKAHSLNTMAQKNTGPIPMGLVYRLKNLPC